VPVDVKLAIVGYGNVSRALVRLLRERRQQYPFQITGIHTLHHGTAMNAAGLDADPEFGPRVPCFGAFLDGACADALVELTTLEPLTGEPAASHMRAALARGMHVVTANKGPIAHCYAALRDEAEARGVKFRFESTVMDGAPVFNVWRNHLPAVKVLGFTGALNSTSKIVVETMERGGSFADGLAAARNLGITEGDGSYDVEGWDSACKTAALANVLLDARTTPQLVYRRGITRLTPKRAAAIAKRGKTVRLVSRARRTPSSSGHRVLLQVRAEILDRTDILASAGGTSNLILFHTDLMGTFGTVSVNPTVEQTAYGVFSDLVSLL